MKTIILYKQFMYLITWIMRSAGRAPCFAILLPAAITILFYPVIVNAQSPVITAAEYYWNIDPGFGNATSLSVTQGYAVDIQTIIPTNTISPGFNSFNVRVKDNAGRWSHAYNAPVWITDNSAGSALELNHAEYYWDNDPGFGNGTTISITSGKAIDVTEAVSTATLSPGFHRYCIRVRDNYGKWSHTYSSPVWITPGISGTSEQIITAEYFWDNDPGFDNGTIISVSPGSAVDINEAISTSLLSSGFHRFYIRTKDSKNRWSQTYSTPIWITPDAGTSTAQIVSAEYFWDTDPGFSNGTILSVINGNVIDLSQSISTSSLNPGFHRFYIRTLDSKGRWSQTYSTPVWVTPDAGASTTQIVSAEYFWDTDPGFSNGTSLSVINGNVVDLSQSISTSALNPGFHRFYIRTLDNKGRWSQTYSTPLWLTPAASATTLNIIAVEYFWDSDPGFANGNAISFTPSGLVDINQVVGTSTLTPGIHRLYVRSQDENGRWSHTYNSPVWVSPDASSSVIKIIAAEYFWDTDPGFANGIPISVTPAGMVDLNEIISTSVSPGIHRLYLRTMDENNRWSHTYISPVWITDDKPFIAANIVEAEYFWNIDPGAGSGLPLALTAVNPVINGNFDILACGLPTGTHKLYVRVKDENGRWSHCYIQDVNVTDNGSPAPPTLSISSSVQVCPGDPASFSLSSSLAITSYQWEESTDNGNNWLPLSNSPVYSGTTTNILNISQTSLSMDGNLYRCIVISCGNNVISGTASLNMSPTPVITSHPSNVSQTPGNGTSFSIIASNATSYQWYEDQGIGWNALTNTGVYSGVNSNVLSISDVAGLDGFMYRCIASGCNTDDTSNYATLSMAAIYSITAHPHDTIVCAGNPVNFGIATTGTPTYQWYQNAGTGWTALADAGVYSGVTSDTLSISNTTGLDGHLFHCIISGAGPDISSDTASLSLYALPSISAQPANITECPGNGTNFSITASGYNISYLWYENAGTGWTALADAGVYSGVTTASLAISDVSGLNGYLYNCVVSGCGTSVTSSSASLNVYQAPTINVHPQNALLCAGGISFSFNASGSNMSYQWYENQGSGWIMLNDAGVYSGSITDTLQISDASLLNGFQYQCVITTCSMSVTSNAATITFSSANTWLGYNTEWSNSSNWSCGIPNSASNVIIPGLPAGGSYPVVIDNSNAVCGDITIDVHGQLTVNTGKDLTVFGNWTNYGATDVGQGTIIFGGAVQTINGTTKFRHLTVNNGSTITMLSPQQVSGILLCNGTMNASGNLTLLSDASGTALIDGSGTGTVNGDVIMQRFIPSAKAKGYKHFSSAFSNAVFAQFGNFMTLHLGNTTNTPYPTIFKYSETMASPYFANGWVEAAPQGQVNNAVDIASGYTVQFGSGSSNDITSYLTGTVNNGNIPVTLTRDNPGSGKGDGWNLVGNPYPSPIDLDLLPFTAANINKSVSIFISTSIYNGFYGYYNAVLHLPLNGGTRHLGALHAFFVQCNSISGGTLTFTNAIRSKNLNPTMYKNNVPSDFPLVRLSAASNNPNSLKDETAIMFLNDATHSFDADYDVSKIMNTETSLPNLYSVSYNDKLAMNGLPDDFSSEVIVPLGFTVNNSGIYIIKAEEISNIPSNVSVFLEDKASGKLHKLTDNPVYTFSANNNSYGQGRFYLKFGETVAGINNEEDNSFSFSAWAGESKLQVNINGEKDKGIIQLFDALGRIILTEAINSNGLYTYYLNLPAGTYTVRYTGSNNIESRKVFMN